MYHNNMCLVASSCAEARVSMGKGSLQRGHVMTEAGGLARRGCMTVGMESQARHHTSTLLLLVQVGLESLK